MIKKNSIEMKDLINKKKICEAKIILLSLLEHELNLN
jgi:hypothetical protein